MLINALFVIAWWLDFLSSPIYSTKRCWCFTTPLVSFSGHRPFHFHSPVQINKFLRPSRHLNAAPPLIDTDSSGWFVRWGNPSFPYPRPGHGPPIGGFTHIILALLFMTGKLNENSTIDKNWTSTFRLSLGSTQLCTLLRPWEFSQKKNQNKPI